MDQKSIWRGSSLSVEILLETKTCYLGLTLVAYPHSFLLVYLPLCLLIPWSPGSICAIYSGGFRPSKERSQSLLTTWGNASRNRQRKPRSSLLDSDSWRCTEPIPIKKKQVSICLKGLRYEFWIPLAPVGITTFAQLIERASELKDIIKDKEVKAISFPRMAQTKSWQTFQKSLYHSRWKIRAKNIKSKRSTISISFTLKSCLKFLCPLELSSCLTPIKNLFQVLKTIPATVSVTGGWVTAQAIVEHCLILFKIRFLIKN